MKKCQMCGKTILFSSLLCYSCRDLVVKAGPIFPEIEHQKAVKKLVIGIVAFFILLFSYLFIWN